MAARFGVAPFSALSTGTGNKTLLQLVSANIAIRVVELSIFFRGTSNTAEPITVQLVRQTDAGTMSAGTVNKADDSVADALNTTAQENATVEPTSTDVLFESAIHPQTGGVFQMHDLGPIIVGVGDRIGLRVNAPSAVNSHGHIRFEE